MTKSVAIPDKKISEDSAKLQISSLLEYYGLDFKDIEIEDGQESAQTLMNTLVRAITRGELEINVDPDLSITQHLKFPTENCDKITYLDKVSKAKISMGEGKNSQARLYAFMGALSGNPATELMKLKGSDATVLTRLSVVFSMV